MSLSAGKLRHVISIEEQLEIVDSNGEREHVWVPFVSRAYAAIEPLSARELIAAQAEYAGVTARITIRYRHGLNHAMRIVHKNTIYNIEGLIHDNMSGIEWLTIPVSTGLRRHN